MATLKFSYNVIACPGLLSAFKCSAFLLTVLFLISGCTELSLGLQVGHCVGMASFWHAADHRTVVGSQACCTSESFNLLRAPVRTVVFYFLILTGGLYIIP